MPHFYFILFITFTKHFSVLVFFIHHQNVINLPKKKDASCLTEFSRIHAIHTTIHTSNFLIDIFLDIWLITQRLSNTNDTLFSLHSFIVVINRVKMMRKLFFYSNVVTKRYELSMHKCLLNKSKNNGIFL